jgi:hypothetical protein
LTSDFEVSQNQVNDLVNEIKKILKVNKQKALAKRTP